MAGTRRSNKAPRAPGDTGEQAWFKQNRKRARSANKAARKARKRNRGR